MERKDFIKRGVLGSLLLSVSSAFGNMATHVEKLNKSGYRGVEDVLAPTGTHMVGNGFKVMNFYPGGRGFDERMSPFYLLDFNAEVSYPPSDLSRGVGVHPHRGIETVSFAYKGSIAHNDSAGNSGVINPGDVQWMTAGGGVLHKEYQESNYVKHGGSFEMVQLWVNLPARHKMTPPKYQPLMHKEKPKVALKNNAGELHVIAGEYNGTKGKLSTFSPLHIYDLHLNAGSEFIFELPAGYNSAMLLVEGDMTVNDNHAVPHNHYVQLKNEAGLIHLKASKKSIVLVLSGQPLNEPAVGYGPFVMNTEAEIHQAIADYQSGKFGHLAD